MPWFSWLRRKPDTMRVGSLVFLGEQDGPPERELKQELAKSFQRRPTVKAAYLARVAYGTSAVPSVALCVRTHFLDDGQESELVKVCPAFFVDSIGSRPA